MWDGCNPVDDDGQAAVCAMIESYEQQCFEETDFDKTMKVKMTSEWRKAANCRKSYSCNRIPACIALFKFLWENTTQIGVFPTQSIWTKFLKVIFFS